MTSPTPPALAVPAAMPRVPFAVYPSAAQAMKAVQRRLAGAPSAGLAWDPQRHVLGRMGFGLRRGEEVQRFDPDVWFAQQTSSAIPASPYSGVDGLVDALPCLTLGADATRDWVTANTSSTMSGAAMGQLSRGTAVLQAFSPYQLFEALTDVFANHLNVVNGTEGFDFTRNVSDRVVIRANVFGRFADMLWASARDVAMLRYLNNDLSSMSAMNENYGREVLELHTVGVNAGYSQAEVVDSARILTGRGRNGAVYEYTPKDHWSGPVKVLGFSDPNPAGADGEAVGDRYLDYLAHHPATATNVATKLCLRMVSDSPSPALIDAVAKAYLANDTQILPMVKTILCSSEFWASRGVKSKRPVDNVVSLVRALGVPLPDDINKAGIAVAAMLNRVGQRTFGCLTPNGYSLRGIDWLSAGRWADLWALQQDLVQGRSAGLPLDADAFLATAVRSTVAETWNVLGQQLIGTALQPGQVAALCAHFGDAPTARFDDSVMQKRQSEALMMLARVPQFTVC